jgi:hypothetical protein
MPTHHARIGTRRAALELIDTGFGPKVWSGHFVDSHDRPLKIHEHHGEIYWSPVVTAPTIDEVKTGLAKLGHWTANP